MTSYASKFLGTAPVVVKPPPHFHHLVRELRGTYAAGHPDGMGAISSL